MKNCMLQGVSLQTVIENKEAVTEEDEQSSGTAKKLLDIIHFLNPILPNLCKAVGVKRKNAHCLPVFFCVC